MRNAVLVSALPDANSAVVLDKWIRNCCNPVNQLQRGDLVISFNYDLLLENQLRTLEMQHSCVVELGVPIHWADETLGSFNDAQYSFDLLKLHGSLDWYRIKGSEGSDLRTICRVSPRDPSWPLYCRDNPLFIPMAHTKGSFLQGNLFTLLWNKAGHYLEQAEEIRFLGYGFPPTDTSNLYFLLRHRDRICEVVVHEDEDSRELSRLRGLLGREKVINRDACAWLAERMQSKK